MDGHVAEHRGEIPDVIACEAGELTAPAESHRDTTEQRQELVAAVERPGEAHVTAPPHAVDRLDALRLTQHVLKTHLHVMRYDMNDSPGKTGRHAALTV